MIARTAIVSVIPAFVSAGVGAEAAASLIAQAITGPSAIFGTEAVWQWGLLLAAGAIIFRAGSLVKHIDAIEDARARDREALEAARVKAMEQQTAVNAGIIARLESLERWRSETDRVVMEWQIRSGIDRRHSETG